MQPAAAVKKMAKTHKQTVTSKALMPIKMTTLWADRPLTCLMKRQQRMSQRQAVMMTHNWSQTLMMQQLLESKTASTKACKC